MLHLTLAHPKLQLKRSLEEEEEEAVVALVDALMEGVNLQHNDHITFNMAMDTARKDIGEQPATLCLQRHTTIASSMQGGRGYYFLSVLSIRPKFYDL